MRNSEIQGKKVRKPLFATIPFFACILRMAVYACVLCNYLILTVLPVLKRVPKRCVMYIKNVIYALKKAKRNEIVVNSKLV